MFEQEIHDTTFLIMDQIDSTLGVDLTGDDWDDLRDKVSDEIFILISKLR